MVTTLQRQSSRTVNMPTHKLTAEIITAAIEGFESQKRRIDAQIAELRAMLPGGPTGTAATPVAPTGKRKKFSAAARQRMKEAQQRRWAKIRGESEPPAPTTQEPAKPKRKLSKAGRAAIVAALKERWAAKRAAAKKPAKAEQPPASKKTPAKKAPVKARKAAKKGAARRAKNAAATPPAVPVATA